MMLMMTLVLYVLTLHFGYGYRRLFRCEVQFMSFNAGLYYVHVYLFTYSHA